MVILVAAVLLSVGCASTDWTGFTYSTNNAGRGCDQNIDESTGKQRPTVWTNDP
jgi:hypothetical protein